MTDCPLFDPSFLRTCLWQATLCLAIGAVLCRLWRDRPARAHLIITLSVAAALTMPVLSRAADVWGWGILPSPTAHESPAASPNSRDGAQESAENSRGGWAAALGEFPWVTSLGWGWIVLSGLFLLRFVVSFGAGMHLLARARPLVDETIHRRLEEAGRLLHERALPMAFTTDRVRCPAIWCWSLHPALLLPPALVERRDSVDWDAIFRHELAHLRRRDHFAALFVELALCVLFWHPLMWWIRRRLYLLSDQACDEWVVRSGEPAEQYAETLLSFAAQRRTLSALSMVSSRSALKQRLDRILTARAGESGVGRTWALCALAIVASGVVLAGVLRPTQETDGIPQNLLRDDGMEEGGAWPEFWLRNGTVEGVEFIWDRQTAHRGRASLCLSKNVARYFPVAEWTQSLPNPPPPDARKVRLVVWVKTQDVAKATLDVQFMGANGAWSHKWAAYIGVKEPQDLPANHNWREVQGTVDIPPNTQKIAVALQIYGPGKIWFDDVSAIYAEATDSQLR
jgi:beta-lactamase regulating signal transducer with metallopeptidase domain